MKTIFLILSIVTLSFSTNILAQDAIAQPELESGTIESQFDYIIEKSSSFKEFQLIRRSSILKVKNNALDSVKNLRKELIEVEKQINPLQEKITNLQHEVTTLNKNLTAVADQKDSILFLGKDFDKTTYSTMVWSIIGLLILLLIFVTIRLKGSSSTTHRTKKEFEKIESEFDEFRKKSLKKEQEIMRKLQDEINKNGH
jgi:peptidoglycan hydrolase CwlO-like protein